MTSLEVEEFLIYKWKWTLYEYLYIFEIFKLILKNIKGILKAKYSLCHLWRVTIIYVDSISLIVLRKI